MFICRLFNRDRPFEQIDSRQIAEGEITVGRDAEWTLPDPDGVLSRTHLTLAVKAGRLFVYDRSTNGAYLGDGRRLLRDQPHELFPQDTLAIGGFSLLIDRPAVDVTDTIAALLAPATSKAEQGDPGPTARRETSLIEAFCDGAKLDVSALSSEDAHELMRRVGGIYQQAVLGLAALMADRARLKGDHDLDRTTISASANNPFKWTPARKLALDLLRHSEGGFLSGAEAVQASFDDLKRHMNALTEGADLAVNQIIQDLSPDAIEAEAKAQASLLRSRQAVCWDILVRRHASHSKTGRVAEDGHARRDAAVHDERG